MTTVTSLPRFCVGMVLAGMLAACAAVPVEECEPGVGDISGMGTVTYPGC